MAQEADFCVNLRFARPVSDGSRRAPPAGVQAPGRVPTAGPGPTPSTPGGPALPSRSFPPPSAAATSAGPPEVSARLLPPPLIPPYSTPHGGPITTATKGARDVGLQT